MARIRFRAVFVCVVTGAALVYSTLDMPAFGTAQAPIHEHVAPDYIARTPDDIGVPNIVTGILASYRGYDTLGETTVIFTAAVAVILLLGSFSRKKQKRTDKE